MLAEVRAQAGAEVIQHAHAVAAANQGIDQMRADKSGPTRHQAKFRHASPICLTGEVGQRGKCIEKRPQLSMRVSRHSACGLIFALSLAVAQIDVHCVKPMQGWSLGWLRKLGCFALRFCRAGMTERLGNRDRELGRGCPTNTSIRCPAGWPLPSVAGALFLILHAKARSGRKLNGKYA